MILHVTNERLNLKLEKNFGIMTISRGFGALDISSTEGKAFRDLRQEAGKPIREMDTSPLVKFMALWNTELHHCTSDEWER